jgi:prepilin-type N-terminal cleavage/methylation domain-containing protein
MGSNRGFTLVETLIATAVLVTGLVAVAQLFPYAIQSNASSRQTTTATMIVDDKLEALRALPLADAALNAGGSLDPASPATGYYDYVTVASNGAVTVSASSSQTAYLRLWQVSGTNPKTITVVIYAVRNGISRKRLEATRSSTLVTDTF